MIEFIKELLIFPCCYFGLRVFIEIVFMISVYIDDMKGVKNHE